MTHAFSVALVGPDGVGKTTIGRRLERTLPVPVKYIYMGDNMRASNVLLPTTRIMHALARRRGTEGDEGGPPPLEGDIRPNGWVSHPLSGFVSTIGWLNDQIAEEWFRQLLAWWHQRRGRVVLFDRHFFCDYYAHEIAASANHRSKRARLHGLMLHVFPRPDLVIFLDAPADVVFARKGEGTRQSLESRRQEYPPLRHLVRSFVVVDATQSEDSVARSVADIILDFRRSRSTYRGSQAR